MKKLLSVLLLLVGMTITPKPAQAVTVPQFPSCTTPHGDIIANYSEGVHGIVGETSEYSGSDTVYKLNDAQIIQCFCPKDVGQGIQTLWWKYSNLTNDDLSVLGKQGWIFVPTGKVWGLDNAPYVARNTRFDCRGNGIGGGQTLGITEFAATGSQAIWLTTAITGVLGIGFVTAFKSRK